MYHSCSNPSRISCMRQYTTCISGQIQPFTSNAHDAANDSTTRVVFCECVERGCGWVICAWVYVSIVQLTQISNAIQIVSHHVCGVLRLLCITKQKKKNSSSNVDYGQLTNGTMKEERKICIVNMTPLVTRNFFSSVLSLSEYPCQRHLCGWDPAVFLCLSFFGQHK